METITYDIGIVGTALYPTGRPRRQHTRHFKVQGEKSFVGGMVAIEKAVAQADATAGSMWVRNPDYSAYVTPQPMPDWPVGTPVARDQQPYTYRGGDVAWDRPETDPCERGTVGCSLHHHGDPNEECETW